MAPMHRPSTAVVLEEEAAGFEGDSMHAVAGASTLAAQLPGVAIEARQMGAAIPATRPGEVVPVSPAGAPVAVTNAGVPSGRILPCTDDPDLFFAESPDDVEFAKELCRGCPARMACLAGALERREPWGVWGGELFLRGEIVPRKRPRGRPRKDDVAA
jgi:WhiB family transcriptional regulator, redox-sensing transcriptional regulator